jgi:hypothetical protein
VHFLPLTVSVETSRVSIYSNNSGNNNNKQHRNQNIMKPQSLQDAIKANALKKATARQNGGWKEPVVKVHKVTADDMKRATPAAAMGGGGVPGTATAAMAMPTSSYELTAINGKLSEILQEIRKQGSDIKALREENERLREEVRQMKASNDASMSASASFNYPSSMTNSPVSPKKTKPPAALDPHTAADLVEAQRQDKALRQYMKTKEGLYEAKYMSLRPAAGGNIVCFKKRIYVPATLRKKTIDYYKRYNATDSQALEALRKNCIWLELEKDFYGV